MDKKPAKGQGLNAVDGLVFHRACPGPTLPASVDIVAPRVDTSITSWRISSYRLFLDRTSGLVVKPEESHTKSNSLNCRDVTRQNVSNVITFNIRTFSFQKTSDKNGVTLGSCYTTSPPRVEQGHPLPKTIYQLDTLRISNVTISPSMET